MGKKNIEIAGPSDGTIEMLKKAYALEMSAFHYWFYIDPVSYTHLTLPTILLV